MARGGARPGAGRPARKSANTSPVSARARARAREAAGNQRPWPADKVERWSIDRLIPYAKNARTHSDAQVAAIAASIKEWGWTTPALVGEDGGLIAGHARILAARQLGIAEIPVMVAAGWTEAQKAPTLPLPRRVRAPARESAGNQRPWPADMARFPAPFSSVLPDLFVAGDNTREIHSLAPGVAADVRRGSADRFSRT
jgi:hypothetical protein